MKRRKKYTSPTIKDVMNNNESINKFRSNYKEMINTGILLYVLPKSYRLSEVFYLQMRFFYDYCFILFTTLLVVWGTIIKYKIRKIKIQTKDIYFKKFPNIKNYLKEIENEKLEFLKTEIEYIFYNNIYLGIAYENKEIELPFDIEIKYLYVSPNTFWKFFYSFYFSNNFKFGRIINFPKLPNFRIYTKYPKFYPNILRKKTILDRIYNNYILEFEKEYINNFLTHLKENDKRS